MNNVRENLIRKGEPNYQICSRCIYDTAVPNISFNEEGVCNYCEMSDSLKEEFKTATDEGQEYFLSVVEQMKKDGKGKKYDCAIGVSGGVDSSFMVHYAVQLGLRPLAVHYDNTWNTSIATENIRKVLAKLNVDLYTHVVDNKESDDIYKAFLKAGVPELDAATDLALAETHFRAASKYNIKYVLEGHSFMEEGVSPLGHTYFDGKYIKAIHKKFGERKMKTYPLMTFGVFMKWIFLKRIKKIRPFWYIKYSKKDAVKMLEKEYGWTNYGGHHLENRASAFSHVYFLPVRFGFDQRNNTLSARVRNGNLDREEALRIYSEPPTGQEELIAYFKKRLNLTDEEFDYYMNQPIMSWHDYPTYKKRFERLRPVFYFAYKGHYVPKSFYLKYCF